MSTAIPWRQAARARLASEVFDLVIIGGGITGAGVARDAALRGMAVALLEADDFASGTSNRSSRLVHGGVRYLEHGHLHLVFESSAERATLLRIAPHLVRPLAFTWPVYRGARIGRWKLGAGLTLYDALSLFRNVERHAQLDRDGVLSGEPMLSPEGLQGGARYFDAATDDARLTLANVIAAVESGAAMLNHAQVFAVVREGGRAVGVEARDALDGGATFTVRARSVLNASGPWSDEVRRLEERDARTGIRGSKGVHIAVPAARVENRAAVTMVHPRDGRVLFTLPAGDRTVFGTTETPAAAGASEIRAGREDVRYLLEAANAYFPQATLGDADVVAAWAGIRPLAAGLARGDAGSASREHTIRAGPSGVVHVTGGKLTTYRAMAEQVVDFVLRSSRQRTERPCETAVRPLPGGDGVLIELEAAAREVITDDGVRQRLLAAHGARWREVWSTDDARLLERLAPGVGVTGAEVVRAVTHEMACTISDVLVRRTHLAFELADHGLSLASRVAEVMAPLLGWHAEQSREAIRLYEREVERLFAIDPA